MYDDDNDEKLLHDSINDRYFNNSYSTSEGLSDFVHKKSAVSS